MILSRSPHSSTGTARGLLRRRIRFHKNFISGISPDFNPTFDFTCLPQAGISNFRWRPEPCQVRGSHALGVVHGRLRIEKYF
jgi:hypothetical protein